MQVKRFWPELLVIVLFLAGDVIWNGMASALAGAAAGVLAFVVLLPFHRVKPALIAEGFLFGAVTAAGTLVEFPGGTTILMELVLGVIMMLSGAFRWNLLRRTAGEAGKGLLSADAAQLLELIFGFFLVFHSLVYSLMELLGFGSVFFGVALFALCYFAGLRIASNSLRKKEEAAGPRLEPGDNGYMILCSGESSSGKLKIHGERTGIAGIHSMEMDVPPKKYLPLLCAALKKKGFRIVELDSHGLDQLELELEGFRNLQGVWRKNL